MKSLLLAVLLLLAACHRDEPRLSVGAAASLRTAMPEVVAAYEAKGGAHVDLLFGASDTLAKRLSAGAALDAVIVADEASLDDTLIAATSRRVIATNAIVLVGPAGSGIDFARLPSLPAEAKLAIGDPAIVPVGRYARSYLQELGSWDRLQPQLVLGGDVAGVLALAQKGTARVAIVYKSDATQAAPLVVLDEPANAPVARITAGAVASTSHRSEVDKFLAFLVSHEAQAILQSHALGPPRP
ncbi:MAG TPA: molybdate ABC transporter substrate-binding protein [Kofleriaceae bacterium]|nr:molybdate ABC transporter substrate-binding protein [Kofleriaceae bacterium]